MNSDELVEILRDLRVEEDPSAAARVAAADRLQRRIDGGSPGPRRPDRRPLLLAGLAVAAAVGVFIIAALGGDDTRLAPASATAAEALDQVADVAADRDDRLLKPGEYWYVKDQERYMTTSAVGDDVKDSYSYIEPSERETWTDATGNGRFRSASVGGPEFFGPRDRANYEKAGSPKEPGRSFAQPMDRTDGFYVGSKLLSYEQLQHLPTDGRKLYAYLLEAAGDAGPSPDEEVFTIIGDLLRSQPIPPAVRAGLYRAAAYVRGIRLVGPVRDQLGREGVGVEIDSADMHRRLVFDPGTALLLAEQDVLAKRVAYLDAAPGTVIGGRVAVRQAIVPSETARP